MRDLSGIGVLWNLDCYMRDRGGDERYASFDYCFNYFQSFRKHGRIEAICQDCLQESCLQLGFYLASWGMLRGSSFLLNKSARFYQRLLQAIIRCDRRVWEIDLPYSTDDIHLLLRVSEDICESLRCEVANKTPSITLVTKTMLGVFGNVPAFDSYFKTGFGMVGNTLTPEYLNRVTDFYVRNSGIIDGYPPIYTLDFRSGTDTDRRYTRAKIVDMIGWVEGRQISLVKQQSRASAEASRA